MCGYEKHKWVGKRWTQPVTTGDLKDYHFPGWAMGCSLSICL